MAKAQNNAIAASQCIPEYKDHYIPSHIHLSVVLQSKMWSVVLMIAVFIRTHSLWRKCFLLTDPTAETLLVHDSLLPWMGNDVTHSAQCPCQKVNENDFFNYLGLLSNSLEGLKWITRKKTRCPIDPTCTVSLCQWRAAVEHQSKFSADLKARFYYWNLLRYSTDFSELKMSRRLGEVWL